MARGEEAANADSMADRFAAIAVVRSTFDHDGRTIHLEHLVVTADPLMGIRGGADPGAERIVHIPLAIDPDDLRATVTTRGLLHLFDFKLAPPGIAGEDTAQHAVDRFLAAASAAQPSDIVIGPEFLVDSAAAAAVGRSLAQTPLNKHRLIAAGSGVTDIGAPGLPWNEMQVFNGLGHPLWSQRKLWPADVLGDVAASLGCPLPAGARGREATRSGDTLVIADVETLGRCVILICQDLKLFPLNALLHDLQCDWALVPILDRGVGEGRWTHQATFGLTEDCQTRFVVGCCVSLGRLLGLPAETPCLMAVGPRNPTESEDTERAFTVKALAPSATSVSIQWREEAWDKTWLRSA
jgi:hypothetical protein